jgi:hypothetical protein
MKTKVWLEVVAGVLFAILTMVPIAQAEQTVTEKGRTVYHFVKMEVMQVGDLPGHIVGIADTRGLNFLDNGEVRNYSSKIIFDLIDGTGTHQTYAITTSDDKSTVTTLHKGVTTARSDGTSTFEGTTTFIGGTGRFAGVKGAGSYSGKRLVPLTPGGPADAFSDYVSTYTLPSQ